MSRPTLPPSPKDCSPDEIAAQVQAFLKAGGKIQHKANGEHALPHTLGMHEQHNLSMRVKINGESKKAAGK